MNNKIKKTIINNLNNNNNNNSSNNNNNNNNNKIHREKTLKINLQNKTKKEEKNQQKKEKIQIHKTLITKIAIIVKKLYLMKQLNHSNHQSVNKD